jgi:hypothetical protein
MAFAYSYEMTIQRVEMTNLLQNLVNYMDLHRIRKNHCQHNILNLTMEFEYKSHKKNYAFYAGKQPV